MREVSFWPQIKREANIIITQTETVLIWALSGGFPSEWLQLTEHRLSVLGTGVNDHMKENRSLILLYRIISASSLRSVSLSFFHNGLFVWYWRYRLTGNEAKHATRFTGVWPQKDERAEEVL